MHGEILFPVQTFFNPQTKEYINYFGLTNQFTESYISERLQEYSAWLACRSSYTKAESILYRNTGNHLISDQKIQQIVIHKATEISKKEAELNISAQTQTMVLNVQTQINLYEKQEKEIIVLEDGIQVVGQKDKRKSIKDKLELPEYKRVWRQTDACMLECKNGTYRYLIGGLESNTQPAQSLVDNVKRAINEEYGYENEPLRVVGITDGAKDIRMDFLSIFGITIIIILDWYHLGKKIKDLMSMIACNKADKQIYVNYVRKHCWEGEVDKAIVYLQTNVKTKNEVKLNELIGYLEKHKSEIINYKKRKKCGKPIGSGRMECGVNQIVGDRQKNKKMSWSQKGSKALAILEVQQLNNKWDELWNLTA